MTDSSSTTESNLADAPFAPTHELIELIRAGAMIVLTDDDDRENEGDLIMAAEHVTPEAMSFIVRHTGGWICVVLDEAATTRLGLEPITEESRRRDRYGTAFLTPIDARRGIGTGISARDRAHTVRVAIDPASTPDDINRGGHVQPLLAKTGGVLVRTGHTEAAMDLVRLAGLTPAAILSEVVDDLNGEPRRLPELITFCREHDITLGSIADLVKYRGRTEHLVERRATVRLPTTHGDFTLYHYRSLVDDAEHVALVYGFTPPAAGEDPEKYVDVPLLVRVHSECLTGEAFGSLRCDCGPQLDLALARIRDEGCGVLLYMRQEGRGIGLEHKMRAYELQEQGLDTVEANLKLGFKADQRDFGIGAQILHDLGVRRMRLLTNNPRKFTALEGYGLVIDEVLPIEISPGPNNERYLRAKKEKLGHRLELVAPTPPEDATSESA